MRETHSLSISKKNKILIFTPGGVGGAERMSVLIGKLLSRDKYEVKYVILGRVHEIYDILPEGYEVDTIPVHNIYCFSTLRIWWKIMQEKPDFVFASQVAYNPRVILAAKLAGRKVVIRSSGMPSDYTGAKLRNVKWTYPIADKIIAQQEEMREDIIRVLNVNPNKVITIHNPLDTANIDVLSKTPSPYIIEGCVNFVQSASVNCRKAQDVSIQALAIVRQKIPNAHLYIIGRYKKEGDYYQKLVKQIDTMNLNEFVHFVGYDKNPFRWIKNADCFVLPSRAEGLPNALIEASYLGVPCVATRCLNIVNEIIKNGQNGYTVEIDDVNGFASAMINAVEIPYRKMIYKPGTKEEIQRLFDL